MTNKQKGMTSVLGIGVLALFLLWTFGMGSHMWGTGMMSGWGGTGFGMMSGWGGMWLGMGFFSVLFLVGLFLLFSDRFSYRGEDQAKAILRERYARGELTEGEYEDMMRRLRG